MNDQKVDELVKGMKELQEKLEKDPEAAKNFSQGVYMEQEEKKFTKKDMENKEIWESLQYRMGAEGFHYCFNDYSSWDEIEDEEFHKLRLNYLKAAKLLEEYVNNKTNDE